MTSLSNKVSTTPTACVLSVPREAHGEGEKEDRSSTENRRREHKRDRRWRERIMIKQRKQVIETYIQREQRPHSPQTLQPLECACEMLACS